MLLIPPSGADNTGVFVAPTNQVTAASMPLTPPSTHLPNLEVVAQVGSSASPSTADFAAMINQVVAEQKPKIITIHPYMPMSNRLVTAKDYIFAYPEVSFVVGTSVAFPEDQKILQSINALMEL